MYARICTLTLALSLFTFTSCDFLESVNPGLTEAEISAGLKSLLKVGADTAAKIVSRQNGFYADALIKLPFPETAANVYTTLQGIPGMQSTLDNFVLQINRAAEDAATEAAPIFSDAVTSMTLQDAAGILHGTDTAATAYLRVKTFNRLDSAFQPKVALALDKPLVFGVSASSAWATIIGVYNLTGSQPVNTNLNAYVTQKALRGLFFKLSVEEKLIREDPKKQVTEAIRKIFS